MSTRGNDVPLGDLRPDGWEGLAPDLLLCRGLTAHPVQGCWSEGKGNRNLGPRQAPGGSFLASVDPTRERAPERGMCSGPLNL